MRHVAVVLKVREAGVKLDLVVGGKAGKPVVASRSTRAMPIVKSATKPRASDV